MSNPAVTTSGSASAATPSMSRRSTSTSARHAARAAKCRSTVSPTSSRSSPRPTRSSRSRTDRLPGQRLTAAGVRHEAQEYDGTHASRLVERLQVALRWLSRVLERTDGSEPLG